MLALLLCNLPNLKTVFMSKLDDWNFTRDLFDHAGSDSGFFAFDKFRRFPIETEDTDTGVGLAETLAASSTW